MKITQTNGNGSNGIQGCRITVKTNSDKIIDVIYARTKNQSGLSYCKQYPNGEVAKKLSKAMHDALIDEGSNIEEYVYGELIKIQKKYIKYVFERYYITSLFKEYLKIALFFNNIL